MYRRLDRARLEWRSTIKIVYVIRAEKSSDIMARRNVLDVRNAVNGELVYTLDATNETFLTNERGEIHRQIRPVVI